MQGLTKRMRMDFLLFFSCILFLACGIRGITSVATAKEMGFVHTCLCQSVVTSCLPCIMQLFTQCKDTQRETHTGHAAMDLLDEQ